MLQEELVSDIAMLEEECQEYESTLREEFPEAWAMFQALERNKEKKESLKRQLKEILIGEEDLDIHENSGYKYSVSKVVRLAVDNIDLVPDEFKDFKEVANERKAQDYYKLMGEAPEGFKDKSYYKLNMKEANNG